MTTPDSPAESQHRLVILDHAVSSSKRTSSLLLGSSVGTMIVSAVASFFHPVPLLWLFAIGLFMLWAIYQTGRALIDHHASVNTLIPLEIQVVQARASQEAMSRFDEFRKGTVAQTSNENPSGPKVAPSSAIGLTGRKVN